MGKIIIAGIAVVLFYAVVIEVRNEQIKVAKVNKVISDMTSNSKEIMMKMNQETAANQKARHDAKIVRIWVRKKSTKECMRILKINEINNEVADCNKDRYVEVRNDEIAQFRKDNEL